MGDMMERFLESTRAYYPGNGMLNSGADFSSGMSGFSPGGFGASPTGFSANPFSMSSLWANTGDSRREKLQLY